MQVLHVCSEMFPLLKTGGLADVVGALPAAQIAEGADVRVLLPAFPDVRNGIPDTVLVAEIDSFAGRVGLRYGTYHGVGIYLIDAPWLYDRPGSPYHDQSMYAYPDNHRRFALLGWMACELAKGLDRYWRPQLVHAHDWHAGLSCTYLAANGHPARSVFTVHNLAYQGLFSAHHVTELWLPASFYDVYGLEFYGQMSFLKAGLFYADHVTAVSPTYAREITRPEFGYGMEGLLQERQRQGRLSGILNGVDDKIWDPAHDPRLSARYDADNLKSKVKNKLHLQKAMGLKVDESLPVFAVVSRLTSQKGLDLVLQALPELLAQGGQLALLGAGDAVLQQAFLAAAADYPEQVGVQIGYHESFSHRIIGGADVILVPSRFEPCGLTQLYGLKYGTLPLVRRTGGLADTVVDCALENLADGTASGFVFDDCDAVALANPPLAAVLDDCIGQTWRTDLSQLSEIKANIDYPSFLQAVQRAKRQNKERLALYIAKTLNVVVNPDALFDVQIKRIHEYKRQLLNVLHVITLYNRLLADPDIERVPRVVIFAGKAASAYYAAKQIIRLINDVAKVINNDPRVHTQLKVVFIPNYGVSLAQIIIPAADLSEQISLAGTEASGTSNMKFALNGALTIGTLDGANVEMREHVGEENIFIFGNTAEQVEELRRNGYNPRQYYEQDPELHQALTQIATGMFSPEEPKRYGNLFDSLVNLGDHYQLLADYRSYVDTQDKVDEVYLNQDEWTRRAVLNIANMGYFSSDRTIQEYADEIWHIKPVKL